MVSTTQRNTLQNPGNSFVHLCWANDHRNLFRPFFVSGMWYSILEFLNVAGVVTNSFLVAFTSSYGRSWEGDPTTSNRTELVFNSTSNATDQVVIFTEHLAGPSRLWLIIGFEVSLSIRRGQHLHFQSLHLYPIFKSTSISKEIVNRGFNKADNQSVLEQAAYRRKWCFFAC